MICAQTESVFGGEGKAGGGWHTRICSLSVLLHDLLKFAATTHLYEHWGEQHDHIKMQQSGLH